MTTPASEVPVINRASTSRNVPDPPGRIGHAVEDAGVRRPTPSLPDDGQLWAGS